MVNSWLLNVLTLSEVSQANLKFLLPAIADKHLTCERSLGYSHLQFQKR
ncbi:hypothetical protein [Calothrix sp. NIES-3974]|nr:hypothetical protein [Calothrix sp. NIES-3974]